MGVQSSFFYNGVEDVGGILFYWLRNEIKYVFLEDKINNDGKGTGERKG